MISFQISALALQENPALKRNIVPDCHAEIVARRALQRYLLKIALKHAKSSKEEKRNDVPAEHTRFRGVSLGEMQSFEIGQDGRLRLSPGASVHFYSSSAPCGNATVLYLSLSRHQQNNYVEIFSMISLSESTYTCTYTI